LGAGENPEWIARQLGHATTEMLFRVYSRYVPNLTRRDGSAFERLLTSTMGNGEQQIQVEGSMPPSSEVNTESLGKDLTHG
jgi:integrase